VRVVLAVLIAVVQVAGSWLCCCGPDRWFVERSASPAPAHCDGLAVATAEPAACPHCKPSGAESKPASGKAPRKHAPLPDQCPCGGMKIESVPPAVATTDHGTTAQVFPAPFPIDGFPPHSVVVVGLTPGGISELPFLPAEGRLYAHHVLRC